MKRILTIFLSLSISVSKGQSSDVLNTARNCLYMKTEEREMIYEINRLRNDPSSYLPYIEPMLSEAKNKLKTSGKGSKNFSLTYKTVTKYGKQQTFIDTNWHYTNEEAVKALSTLVSDLKSVKGLSVLQPDNGIYKAARKHAADEKLHLWTLLHTGSDGSQPMDRITFFSPSMIAIGENIAGSFPQPTARDIVIQLLVDEGIPGYGHRHNLLDPQWTHVACFTDGLQEGMYRWIQDFGRIK